MRILARKSCLCTHARTSVSEQAHGRRILFISASEPEDQSIERLRASDTRAVFIVAHGPKARAGA
eukprot:9949559-Lingulodinium_polyedra.AAC.1